jgi:phenazine biosynthesis-like protein
MKLPLYQIDAFTSRMFGGNPAAVVLLDTFLPDRALQAIAAENNLAETHSWSRMGRLCRYGGLRQQWRSICAGMRPWRPHMSFSAIPFPRRSA